MKHEVKLKRTIEVTLDIDDDLESIALTNTEAAEYAVEIAGDEIFISFDDAERKGMVVVDSGWLVASNTPKP